MRTGWSIIAFSIGAFTALGLVWASPTAALVSLGLGALTAVMLVGDGPEHQNEADSVEKRNK